MREREEGKEKPTLVCIGVFHGRRNAARNSFNCPNSTSVLDLLSHPHRHTHTLTHTLQLHTDISHSVCTILHCQPQEDLLLLLLANLQARLRALFI